MIVLWLYKTFELHKDFYGTLLYLHLPPKQGMVQWIPYYYYFYPQNTLLLGENNCTALRTTVYGSIHIAYDSIALSDFNWATKIAGNQSPVFDHGTHYISDCQSRYRELLNVLNWLLCSRQSGNSFYLYLKMGKRINQLWIATYIRDCKSLSSDLFSISKKTLWMKGFATRIRG